MPTTPTITPDKLLASLVTDHAGASRVFHRHGLDFCCNGQRSLAEACEPKGLDVDALIAELSSELKDDPAQDWEAMPIPALIDFILETFHASHREELPRLLAMAEKVEQVHADKEACPKGLARHLKNMLGTLDEHMHKEEEILFPMLKTGQGAMASMPIRVMEQEHEDHGRNLARLHELTNDFTPPEGACNTWRALFLGLAEFERDIMRHIHLENYVLFPRALRD